MRASLWLPLLLACGCEGPAGPQGPQGNPGSAGTNGDAGQNGGSGSDGTSPWLTQAGVAITITDLAFANATATVSFALDDGTGTPLDATGRLTDGKVAVSFVLAQLAVQPDGSPGQYTAYTTRQVTSGSGTTATQASVESSGTLAVADVAHGTYTYTFAAATTGLDPALTQTVVGLATRGTAIANAALSARADHGTPIAREEVTDATCNSCHRALSHHGGRFTSASQCILCHQPQSSDPFTGNTLDFKVMVHKIHDGASLATPYQIVGYMQAVSDFSTVVFPQNIERCTACHAGAQGDRWQTAPQMTTCTSCHDTIAFATPVPTGTVLHAGGTQPDNASCPVCHPATGSLAGIYDKHFVDLLSPTAPTIELAILGFTSTGANQSPVLSFTAKLNGAPANLTTSPLAGLSVIVAGPTADFTTTNDFRNNTFKLQGSGALAGTLVLVDASTGTHQYTFPAPLPILQAAPQGASYQIGMEGFLQPVAGGPRYAAVNSVYAFTVGGTAAGAPRRTIVDRVQCNGCHFDLSFHGGAKKDPSYCVMCHNSSLQNAGTPNQASSLLGFTVDFRSLIHKIHTGTNLTQPFQIGTSDFRLVRYPQDTRNCNACHVTTNWTLPLANSPAYASQAETLFTCSAAGGSDPTQPCPAANVVATPLVQPPTTTVCTSCHDAPYTLAHAQLNTTAGGVEACATCHGPGTQWDVALFHGIGP